MNDQPTNRRERREVLVRVSEYDIIDFFSMSAGSDTWGYLPVIQKLPDGYVIRSVSHDWQRRCFSFAVHHPSFEVVPDGAHMPVWNPDKFAEVALTLRPKPAPPVAEGRAVPMPDLSRHQFVGARRFVSDGPEMPPVVRGVYSPEDAASLAEAGHVMFFPPASPVDKEAIKRMLKESARSDWMVTPRVPNVQGTSEEIKAALEKAAANIRAATVPLDDGMPDAPHVVPAQE